VAQTRHGAGIADGDRLDLEAFLPNLGGMLNHADIWFSRQQPRDRSLRRRIPRAQGSEIDVTGFSM
jgi:hypothetical protein